MIDKFGRTELGRYFYDPSSYATTGNSMSERMVIVQLFQTLISTLIK